MSLLEMSLTAGIMIVAVALIRAVAIDRLPKKTFLALWAVALFRLLAPVSLPSSVSVYNAVPAAARSGALPAALPAAEGAALAETGISPYLAPLVWGVGLLAVCAFFLVSWIRCRRVFRESLPVENEFAQEWIGGRRLRRRVELRQSDRVSSPLAYGLVHPVILLPAGMDWRDTDRLGYILAHEFCHIRRLDGLWKLLLTAALCIHWFNPLAWVMYVLANRDLELSCDENVVHACGETAREAYALTLIGMEERRLLLTPLYNSFSKNAIEERIRAIMKQRKATVIASAAAVMVIVAVTVLFATSAREGKKSAPDDLYTGVVAASAFNRVGYTEREEDDGPDPETGRYYSRKQYDLIAALKTADYAGQSIATFNRALHATLNDDGDDSTLAEAWGYVRSDLPQSDPLASFVYYTMEASIDEYDAKLRAVYAGKKAEYAFDARAERTDTADVFGEQVEVGHAEAYYTFRYDILDQNALTVSQRDKFLTDITAGMQAYLEGMDAKRLNADGDADVIAVKQALQAELDRLGKAGTTANISYLGGTVEEWYGDMYSD